MIDGSILMDGGVESNLGYQEKDTKEYQWNPSKKYPIFVFLNPVCWSWMDASRGFTLVSSKFKGHGTWDHVNPSEKIGVKVNDNG